MMKKPILIVGIMGLILASGGCGMEPVSREEIAEEGDAESTGENETLIQEEESASQELSLIHISVVNCPQIR